MKKSKRTKKMVIVMVLIIALLVIRVMQFQVQAAESTDAPPIICTTAEQLYAALNEANDGDVIGINGSIYIYPDDYMVLGDKEVHVTIKRMSPEASITFFDSEHGTTTFVYNITFDGDGIDEYCGSLVTVVGSVAFCSVTFQNCNTWLQGGAVNVIGGNVSMDDCIFLNNHADSGGHIFLMNECDLQINNSTLIGGIADNYGGAICAFNNGTNGNRTLYIHGCTITGNEADWGGGIYNHRNLVLNECVIYDNEATGGGADILNGVTGEMIITPLVDLTENYAAVGINPLEWVCDYVDGNIPNNVDAEKADAFLKLIYGVIEELPDESNQEDSGDDEINQEITETEKEDELDKNTEESGNDTSSQDTTNGTDGVENTQNPGANVAENTQNPGTSESGEDKSNISTVDKRNDSGRTTNSNSSGSSTSNSKIFTSSTRDTVTTDNSQKPINSSSVTDNTKDTASSKNQIVESTETESQEDNQGSSQENITSLQNNIRIDAKGVDFTFALVDGTYDISIIADRSEQPERKNQTGQGAIIQEVTADSVNNPAETPKGIDWFQVVQTVLLVAIFICILYKPGKRKRVCKLPKDNA